MSRTGTVWGVRAVEWAILALLILGFLWVFGQYARRVHGQAERAAVMTTLGATRTAMVLQYLQTQVSGARPKPLPAHSNPFDALDSYPPNFAGEVQGRDVREVSPGQWAFDPQCACIGYKPLYADALASKEGLDTLWFQRRTQGEVGTLVPLDRYVWAGQLVE